MRTVPSMASDGLVIGMMRERKETFVEAIRTRGNYQNNMATEGIHH